MISEDCGMETRVIGGGVVTWTSSHCWAGLKENETVSWDSAVLAVLLLAVGMLKVLMSELLEVCSKNVSRFNFCYSFNTSSWYLLLSGETGIHQSSKPVYVSEAWLYIILLTI